MPPSYAFKNPFASSIYPNMNPDETLSILHKINASRPVEKRLPTEILLYINEEVHAKEVHASGNALINKIRDRWMPLNGEINSNTNRIFFNWKEPVLNLKEKRYYRIDEPATTNSFMTLSYGMRHKLQDGTVVEHISSADLLYRLRCCFPEIAIEWNYAHYVWVVYIKHNQSGIVLKFYDGGGTASLIAFRREDIILPSSWSKPILDGFAADVLLLMSILHETIDGGRRLVYYHPAAVADLHSDNEQGFIAVPRKNPRRRRDEKSESVYRAWKIINASAVDTSSFESILHDFKYDVPSRKVKLSCSKNAGVDLTSVISSALLFYRLICKFKPTFWGPYSHKDIYTVPPITSVWKVQLTHAKTGHSIIFMDDRGLFDIRVRPGTKALVEIARKLERIHKMLDMVFEKVGMIEDLKALVEVICGDN